MADFRSALASGRTLLLDGGMGTMLQARGLPAGEHPEQFCLDRPDVLRGIHADYLAAGADIILTCTFGGSRLKLPAGIDVTLKGAEGQCTLALWQEDGFSYSLSLSQGQDAQGWAEILSGIR